MSAFILHPRDEGTFTDLLDSDGNPLGLHQNIANIPMLTTTSIPINGGSGTTESAIITRFSKVAATVGQRGLPDCPKGCT